MSVVTCVLLNMLAGCVCVCVCVCVFVCVSVSVSVVVCVCVCVSCVLLNVLAGSERRLQGVAPAALQRAQDVGRPAGRRT